MIIPDSLAPGISYGHRTRLARESLGTRLWWIVTTLLLLHIPGCMDTGNAKWSLKAQTCDNFEHTLVVAGRVRIREVVAEEGYCNVCFMR